MKTYTTVKQLKIEEFKTPFELKLDKNNRWVQLSSQIPWDELASVYHKKLAKDKGRPGIDTRVVIGSLYVKHKLKLSDEETLQTIQENPYIQYFLGLNVYHADKVFDSSLFVTLRKRLGVKEFNELSQLIQKQSDSFDFEEAKDGSEVSNKGKLKIDATVADQYIKYPTDVELLSQSRDWTEKIIDELYLKGEFEIKPRTYRRCARKEYLQFSKKRNHTKKEIRKAIKQQLQYLKRNLGYIEEMLNKLAEKSLYIPLERRSHRYYFIIQYIYHQQFVMFKNKTHSCEDRIVSLHQPHVRPIVRGKKGADVEFGSKINIGLDNGFVRIDHFEWNNYNEGCDLKTQVEAYKSLHGYYPELVQCDRIYATRENRKYLKEKKIRITADPLGRKPVNKVESISEKRKRKKEANERNAVEGKFGQSKNGYNLNKIRARLPNTSESMVGAIVFVMNVINLINGG